MDRDKKQGKRGSSKIKPLHVADFIALGTKSSRAQSETTDQKIKTKSTLISSSSTERKSEASSSSSVVPTKKAKLSTTSSPSQIKRVGSVGKKDVVKGDEWEAIALEIDSADLVNKVLEAEDSSDDEKVEAILCGAVKKLKSGRLKFDSLLFLSLQYLVKTRPFLFCSELIVEAFCSLLKRDMNVNFKGKANNLVSILAANVLMSAYKDESSWPEVFVKSYVEDSLGERVWVDHDYCKGFVDNILTAFNTKSIPKSLMIPERLLKPEACPSPPTIGTDDDESCSSVSIEVPENIDSVAVYPRYVYSEDSLTQHVLEVIKEQLTRRQPAEISRNTLKFFVSTSGISEVRLTVCQKLEIWLQNPKLTKPAQELLLAVCLNCNLHNQHDVEVISQLIKIRIKAKPVVNHYLLCMKELIGQHPENLSTLLKHSIYNELSNSRNPNNMQLLSIIFLHSPDRAAKVLAEVFLDLLCNRDDYLRALRALLREIVRTVRYDLNFSLFCIGLLQERRDPAFLDLEPALKERVFLSITDLIVLAIFVGISPAVKEQFSMCTRGEKKDLSHLRSYQITVANIQRDSVWWLFSVVPKIFGKTGRNEFVHCIHKLLFMEQIEHYYNKDNWPTESERMLLLRLASEVPLLEDTLMRVLIIGLSRDHPLSAADALELADQLVKRAAVTYFDDFPVLEFENTELCDIIFNLCAYHHPENITLPQGYHPPNLAISELYWKAWTMLLVIVCHNPSTFGDMAWKTYPMLRNLMEMCITNQFVFPPPTLALGEKADEIKSRELQMTQMEKDQILLFESHLAAASTKVTITESNSLLLSKLISMDPHGPARKPPSAILEQLKKMNQNCRLGDLLCRSRNPDFLLDVIHRQGTTQSMSWLSELVESSASSFSMLPVQCLCEFLISEGSITSEATEDGTKTFLKKKKKQQQLLFHLQNILHEGGSEPRDTIEVISYFMKRLSSQQTGARAMAIRGLTMLLSQPLKSPTEDDEDIIPKSEGDYSWLLMNIPQLPHFEVIRLQISVFLRQACQIENDPITISSYVTFLAERTPEQNLQENADLALDMAQMIVERPTIVNTILPNEGYCNEYSNSFLSSVSQIFFKYLSAAKMPSKEVYSWSESQDQILIQWYTGESATMHILVVHAMIIVLTYGPPPSSGRSYFDALLKIWFPTNADPPKAFLVDTSEEALLLPDWLKLRMIRSSVGILVDAALKDLDPSQLVLFIQSFGIPVSSMSKLLKTLDLAVECDSFSVEQAVLDKSYMSQLVEVQHRRGASGGEKFAKLLVDSDITEISTDCDAVPNQTPVIQRAPPKLPTAVNIDSLSVSLIKLLGLNASLVLNAKQEQDLFKGLQKALSKDILSKRSESGAIGVFILTCEQILRSESKMAFLQALHKKSYYSSVLFRLATASQSKVDINKSPLAQKLKWTCQQIIYALSGTNSSLVTVASQFYNKHKIQEAKKPAPWKVFIRQFDQDKLDSESIIKIVQAAEADDSLRLEEVMQHLVKNAISKGDTKPLMNAMTNITLKRLTDKVSINVKTFNRSKFCFFVDWLECLEPKIISSFPKSQCHLLFSLVGAQEEPISVPFRPYLLALLIHQSSWEILHYYIDTVLNLTNTDIKFDPTSVLDFLYACIYIPKIWQGRYKKKSKRGNEEDILALTESQTKAVINYILEEALIKYPAIEMNKADCAAVVRSKEFHTLEQRLKLLLMCLALRRSLINTSVLHLLQIISEGGLKGKLAQELLVQAYHQIPSILTLVVDAVSLSEGSNVKNIHCKLDIISHTLLISLARTDATKNCSAKMAKIEFICKKLASTHPVLLLRQLPMMTSLLRGRCHLEYHLFRLQNHVALFSCFLSILELLPPYIFKAEYCSDLNCILCLYMDVFQTYGSPKEIAHLLNRFFGFLLQYLAAKPSQARQFIHQYIDILQDLASTQQDLLSIRSILTGTCMHLWGLSNSASDEKMESSIHDVITGLQFNSNASQASVASIMHRFSQETYEDTAAALQELESISYRKPAVLEHVVDHLKALMHDSNPQFRMTSFNLVMRYVKNNPCRGKSFISTYLQCLESDQVDIVLTALEHLPEFVVLVQEYATVLLQKTFSVGMMKNINTAQQIRGTISYLVAQSGC